MAKQKPTLNFDTLAAKYGTDETNSRRVSDHQRPRPRRHAPSRPESSHGLRSEVKVFLGTLAVGAVLTASGVHFMEHHGYAEHNPWGKNTPAYSSGGRR